MGIMSGARFGKVARAVALVLAALAFVLMFQGSRGLWERDEGRYTSVALQMVRSGRYVVPAYNAEVLHLSKPPLTYWAIAGGMTLLGQNEWGARLPNAIAFVGTLLALFGLGRRITPDRPWLPPLVYATSIVPFVAANIVTTDTLLSFWEALAVWAFVEWWCRQGQPRLALLLLMWCAFGLAFLTKGPPGLLPLLAITVFSIAQRGWKDTRRIFHPFGLLAFLALGLTWYGLVEVVRPGTVGYWVHDEVLGRVASNLHRRNPQWYKALTVYGPVLVAGCIPWLTPVFRGVLRSVEGGFSPSHWKERMARDPWAGFLFLWFFLPLLVLLLSSSRLPLYVLPLMAPLALATARWVNLPLRSNREVPLLLAWGIALLGTKYAVSRHPVPQDSRALARAVIASVQAPPKELLFVNAKPSWGVGLYLQSRVARIDTDLRILGREEGSESFTAEMEADEPGRLMIVDQDRVERILAFCRAHGLDTQVVGGYASWRFIPLPNRRDGSPGGHSFGSGDGDSGAGVVTRTEVGDNSTFAGNPSSRPLRNAGS